MKRKEVFWLIGTLGLVLVLMLVLFGLDGFKTDSTFDINIHDTYFVIANFHLVLLLLVFTFFTVYLFRTIKQGFKNFTANLILMIVIILFIIVLGKAIGMMDFFSTPTNNEIFIEGKNPVGNALSILSKFMLAIQIGLLVSLSYCGFKAGRNYNMEK